MTDETARDVTYHHHCKITNILRWVNNSIKVKSMLHVYSIPIHYWHKWKKREHTLSFSMSHFQKAIKTIHALTLAFPYLIFVSKGWTTRSIGLGKVNHNALLLYHFFRDQIMDLYWLYPADYMVSVLNLMNIKYLEPKNFNRIGWAELTDIMHADIWAEIHKNNLKKTPTSPKLMPSFGGHNLIKTGYIPT